MFISKRKREPAHYMLKVESFSLLSEAQTTKIESDVFKAVDHKWRLDVYPNGYDEENKNKDKHISLYVVLCDTRAPVHVDVIFFVYDHINQDYATFQDVSAPRTTFNKSNVPWGFNKLMSLETFTDRKNGFLYNDSCVFGVEINVAAQQFTQVDRCLLMTKPPSNMNSFTWKINKFSTERQNIIDSDVFRIGKVKWKLLLYPKGNRSANGKSLSLYLRVQDTSLYPKGWKVYAKFKFRVRSDGSKRDIEKETESWFRKSNKCWGFPCLMPLSQLEDSESSFWLNDKLTVDVEISAMGTLKDFV